jgi:hypothetical protein
LSLRPLLRRLHVRASVSGWEYAGIPFSGISLLCRTYFGGVLKNFLLIIVRWHVSLCFLPVVS